MNIIDEASGVAEVEKSAAQNAERVKQAEQVQLVENWRLFCVAVFAAACLFALGVMALCGLHFVLTHCNFVIQIPLQ